MQGVQCGEIAREKCIRFPNNSNFCSFELIEKEEGKMVELVSQLCDVFTLERVWKILLSGVLSLVRQGEGNVFDTLRRESRVIH
jgi:hypothetical protein